MLHSATNNFSHERVHLREFLRSRGITDEAVLRAMGKIPREQFLEKNFARRAYEDSALPIGSGQTISQPFTVAYMTQALHLQPGEKVLEIGTGSGYQAAVLEEMGCKVFTIERHLPLLQNARKRFDALGYHDIISRSGDGSRGWAEYAPFDAIIVTAGAPDVPETLTKQLNPNGGRLLVPVGSLDIQRMYLVKNEQGKLSVEELPEFKFVPLVGKEGWAMEERG
ncbi:MAG: protein-L-isoaspartate(D-aspartate) O-methyltransferase [Bacteroidota bacterium]|nr:protein-L-isoaspartate(D-aspartate) O-methyltransferase [Bacteroidota bacterium]MDP4229836.1 protein-L-isoaspartate(D-aspartate) O-methyltransferase [Bacteroidota bacterium]MDP4236183.1 protein-L-isoaspartate(D-aspartate) O-methyltransferase [Bacteroidota bacterium]